MVISLCTYRKSRFFNALTGLCFRFTGDDKNSYSSGGKLYIVPTLTSDEIGADAVLNGGTYRLNGCTTNNASACSARSGSGRVINPVQSARLTTQNTHNIKSVTSLAITQDSKI